MPVYTIQAPDGHEIDIDAPNEQIAVSGAQQWYAQNVKTNSPKKDTSITGALGQGVADLVSGVGKTVREYVSQDAGDAILSKDAAKANPNYKSATQQFMHPDDGAANHTLGLDWSSLPRAALEQAPGLALDVVGGVASRRLGPVGQYLTGLATFGSRTAGNEAQRRASARTGDANAEPTADDKLSGLQSTLVQSALNKIGTNAIVNPGKVAGTGITGAAQAAGNVAKAGVVEGATSAAQDAVSQGMANRGTEVPFDTQTILGAGVMGGVGGSTFAAPKGVKETITASRMRDQSSSEATTRAANRVLEAAGGPDKLADPKAGYEATAAAMGDVRRELGDVASTVRNASHEAVSAIERAKSGDAISERDLKAVDAAGNPQLSDLVRQASALQKLTKYGTFNEAEGRFSGGGHQIVRKAAWPLVRDATKLGAVAGAVTGNVDLGMITSHVPEAMGGLASALAAYKGLKAVDRALGLASPAKTFAEKFGDTTTAIREAQPLNQSPTGPKVVPQNSLTTPQPWGPIPEAPQKFKPDIVEPGIAKIVAKLQKDKQQQTAKEALPLLRKLAEQAKPPAPEPPDTTLQDAIKAGKQVVKDRQWADQMRQQYEEANAPQDTPQVKMEDVFKATQKLTKGLQQMADLRQKGLGSNQAEAEAAVSPLIDSVGGLGEVRNPAMGKRASELISAANALKKLRAVPEADSAEAPTQPSAGIPQADAPFVLPESPHVFKEPREAAEAIYAEAVAGGKAIRHAEGFKAGTTRRLAGEEAIYNQISNSLANVSERGAFHKYLSALWGSDSPEVVRQVRAHMLTEFPQHAGTIMKHLSDEVIKGLWTKPKKAGKG
ncbi:hypothetical protein [Rhodopseudomonas palustris]|uniref:hypothetical protein n=1 Tax=Rhodopseudomonas palustris TaxID=1076 RepID=UPI0006423DA2|nr:hypothetical protein [Rhodopseudomonas palustris]